jgi:hypothetical protein
MRALFIITAASVAVLLTIAGQARAQANRTFVSGHGDDTNPCSLSSPCRSFTQALSQTNAGGEITVLDAAGYGAVTITKSVSIINDGVGEAGITVTSAIDAITVNAGATDVVTLRGLTLVGGGVGKNGITFKTGKALNVQNNAIGGFTAIGIAGLSGSGTLNVSDTIISNNGGTGVNVNGTGGAFERIQVANNGGHGLGLQASGLLATVADSVANNNTDSGFVVTVGANVAIVNSRAVGNGTGVSTAIGGTKLSLANTTILGNTKGFNVGTAGTMFTFGNNYIVDTSNTGTLTPIGQQ